MKKLTYLLLLTLVLVSCGTSSDRFKIEGRFLNLNQGEFYVYSNDGGISGVDTIKVNGGRFTYETACTRPSVLMLVFPNFSEQPVFAEPGKSVSISDDASHLKQMEVKGTKDNELMTQFRERCLQATPPETKKYAEEFISDNPDSPVSVYLVFRHFMQQPDADFARASRLLTKLAAKQQGNAWLGKLRDQAERSNKLSVGGAVPRFQATDINGRQVSNSDLSADFGVVTVWASWNFDSQNIQRLLKQTQRRMGSRLRIVSVCLDASLHDCRMNMERDSISWPTVCDGKMFETPVLRQLGMGNIPDNILVQGGKVVARGLTAQQLQERLGGQ